jgi:hypothetical protein
MKLLGYGLLALLAIGVIAGLAGKDKNGSDDGATASAGGSNITVVAAKSTCVSTGVSDVYTGDGRVVFAFTLRNAGGDDGDVSVTPVRHYDDGETNESAMDMMDVPVPAYSTERFHSEQLTYEAHAHEVVSCGLRLDNGTEIPIKAVHI